MAGTHCKKDLFPLTYSALMLYTAAVIFRLKMTGRRG